MSFVMVLSCLLYTSGLEGVVTSFTVEDGRTVTLRRTGKLNAEMRFVRGQTHDSLYDLSLIHIWKA